MIVIIGETHDDILYFDSVVANRREETILNRYKISLGTIFSQEVLIICEQFTSLIASSVLMHIFSQYYVDLVISVGRCMTVSKSIKSGDVIVSRNVIDANVDLSMYNDVALGQIPGFDRNFMVQDDILEYMSQGLTRRTNVDYHIATFLSTDNMSPYMLEILKQRESVFAMDNELMVVDHNSAGIAIASFLRNVPFVVVKVAENNLAQVNNLDTYSNVLSKYIDLGKAVISTINDIGRSDVLEEQGDEN